MASFPELKCPKMASNTKPSEMNKAWGNMIALTQGMGAKLSKGREYGMVRLVKLGWVRLGYARLS